LNDVEGRPISGSNTEKIRMAAEGLEAMTTTPEHSFKCGPFALRNIRESLGLQPSSHRLIDEKISTVKGIALSELQVLAGEMKMDWVAAERKTGARLPLPILVHWKVGHYAAVIKKMEDGRLLVRDPTFMHDFLVAPEVLDRETSGNFLIPRAALGNGWKLLSSEAAAKVFGKGAPTSKDPDDSKDKCESDKKCGMAAYDFDFFKAGLIIMDTPLWYDTPYGPSIDFSLTYRQRGEQVLDSSSYGFGPKWTSNLSMYVQQSDSAGNMVAFLPGGGREAHTLDASSGQFVRQKRNLRKLVKTSTAPITYELQNTDGSKFVFSRSVSTGGYPKYLLSSFSDAQRNTITLSYNSSNRLIAVTDSLGQVSNFYYQNASFPHLVTKISDPFIPSSGIRRSALFSYDSAGRLVKITDPEGIESSFTYHPTQTDFITSLTTPYGITSFVTNPATETNQYVEVTDPLNRKERVEYRHSFNGILPGADPAGELPDSTLIKSKNHYLYYGNTLYWDKKTYVHFPPNPETGLNYDKAVCYKWMWHPTVSYRPIGVISNIKKPFENRIWYEYPNQVLATYGIQMGSSELPSRIGRRLNATETQVEQYEYNELGNTTKHTDTLGRIIKAEYDSTGMDILSVKKQNGTSDETLATYTYHAADPPRLPRTFTNAAGQTSTFSWNARGQIATATQPGNLITTWNYQSTGFLSSIDGPLAGTSDTTSYTYDLYGRVRTETSPGGHTLTYDYDALDRPTLVTYPDGTKEQFSYLREDGKKILDLTKHKDRENRWTLFAYNALRQRTAILDPLSRTTRFNWCYCGSLQDLYDAEGNRTHWDYDIGSRLTGKTYADGRQETYTYDLAGRLDKITDAKGQVKTHSYFKDSQLKEIAYSNSQLPTARVSFTYDTIYGRLATMSDGTGSTSYTYHPVGQPGALMPAT
ncbi:MAG: cysteine peptidase family C39 domain-containing protein, partial [Akkermansiaceae bacterium]